MCTYSSTSDIDLESNSSRQQADRDDVSKGCANVIVQYLTPSYQMADAQAHEEGTTKMEADSTQSIDECPAVVLDDSALFLAGETIVLPSGEVKRNNELGLDGAETYRKKRSRGSRRAKTNNPQSSDPDLNQLYSYVSSNSSSSHSTLASNTPTSTSACLGLDTLASAAASFRQIDDLSSGSRSRRVSRRAFPDNEKDDAYWERRKRNNLAARKSREAKREKENQINSRAAVLEREHLILMSEVEKAREINRELRKRLSKYEEV